MIVTVRKANVFDLEHLWSYPKNPNLLCFLPMWSKKPTGIEKASYIVSWLAHERRRHFMNSEHKYIYICIYIYISERSKQTIIEELTQQPIKIKRDVRIPSAWDRKFTEPQCLDKPKNPWCLYFVELSKSKIHQIPTSILSVSVFHIRTFVFHLKAFLQHHLPSEQLIHARLDRLAALSWANDIRITENWGNQNPWKTVCLEWTWLFSQKLPKDPLTPYPNKLLLIHFTPIITKAMWKTLENTCNSFKTNKLLENAKLNLQKKKRLSQHLKFS